MILHTMESGSLEFAQDVKCRGQVRSRNTCEVLLGCRADETAHQEVGVGALAQLQQLGHDLAQQVLPLGGGAVLDAGLENPGPCGRSGRLRHPALHLRQAPIQ